MAIMKFKPSDIVINNQEAQQILMYFFGDNTLIAADKLTFNDVSFAQAVLVDAIDYSQETKVNTTPPVNLTYPKPIVGKKRDMLIHLTIVLLTRTPHNWWSFPKQDILARPELWPGTELMIWHDWHDAWENRVKTGNPVY